MHLQLTKYLLDSTGVKQIAAKAIIGPFPDREARTSYAWALVDSTKVPKAGELPEFQYYSIDGPLPDGWIGIPPEDFRVF